MSTDSTCFQRELRRGKAVSNHKCSTERSQVYHYKKVTFLDFSDLLDIWSNKVKGSCTVLTTYLLLTYFLPELSESFRRESGIHLSRREVAPCWRAR